MKIALALVALFANSLSCTRGVSPDSSRPSEDGEHLPGYLTEETVKKGSAETTVIKAERVKVEIPAGAFATTVTVRIRRVQDIRSRFGFGESVTILGESSSITLEIMDKKGLPVEPIEPVAITLTTDGAIKNKNVVVIVRSAANTYETISKDLLDIQSASESPKITFASNRGNASFVTIDGDTVGVLPNLADGVPYIRSLSDAGGTVVGGPYSGENKVSINGVGFGTGRVTVQFGFTYIRGNDGVTVDTTSPITVAGTLVSDSEMAVTIPETSGSPGIDVHVDVKVRIGSQTSNYLDYRYGGYSGTNVNGVCRCTRCAGGGSGEFLGEVSPATESCAEDCKSRFGPIYNCHR